MTLLFFALVTCAIFTSTSARFKFSSKALFSLITNFSRHIFNRDWVISWQVLRWLPDLPGLPSHLPEQWWRSREVRWKQLTLGFVRYIFLFVICEQWLLYILWCISITKALPNCESSPSSSHLWATRNFKLSTVRMMIDCQKDLTFYKKVEEFWFLGVTGSTKSTEGRMAN